MADSLPWIENDELFFSECSEGHRWQAYARLFLENNGLACESESFRLRDDAYRFDEWHNEQDLVCNGVVLEIKSRRTRFTRPDDYPYPTIFVDTVHKWNDKDTKPFAYVIISRVTGSMICTRGHDSSGWETVERFDRVREINECFYAAPRDSWRTMPSLVEALKAIKQPDEDGFLYE